MQHEKSCGAIVYRKSHGNTEILLIKHINSGHWSFPKGHMEAGETEIETAIKACNTLGLTFGGVDILDDGSVCEVNSNAHIINIMNSTKIDIAPYIFKTIKGKIL